MSDQFTCHGIDSRYSTVHRGGEVQFSEIGFHFLKGCGGCEDRASIVARSSSPRTFYARGRTGPWPPHTPPWLLYTGRWPRPISGHLLLFPCKAAASCRTSSSLSLLRQRPVAISGMQLLSVLTGSRGRLSVLGISRTLHGHGLASLERTSGLSITTSGISMVYFLSLTGKQMPDAAGNLAGDTGIRQPLPLLELLESPVRRQYIRPRRPL